MNIVKNNIYPNQIKRYRKRVGFTQKDLAKLLGHHSTSHISRYESGRNLPNLTTALKISVATKSIVDVLFGGLHTEISKEILERKKKLNIWERYE